MSKHTPGPWIAIKGDTLNRERPWGISKYLTREAHIEIDGTDEDYPTRTEVIAELTEAQDPREVEHTAYLIAAAPELLKALQGFIDFYNSMQGHKDNSVIRKAQAAINKAEGREIKKLC